MTLWCVVPAAGKGLRVGGEVAKQYLSLAGATVMQQTLNRLGQLENVQLIVALSKEDEYAQTLSYEYAHKIHFVIGGKERADSVLAALKSIPDAAANDWVLVHDVARPCVRVSDIKALLQAVQTHSVGGLLASRVRDTMKQADGQQVAQTIPREQLWHAFTPQVFRVGMLRAALEAAQEQGFVVTDEAQAMERQGFHPLLVEGARDNLKITWPQDLALAEFFLHQQTQELL